MIDNIPHELRAFNQWVCWRKEDTQSGRPTKVPYNPSGVHADPTDSSTWTTFKNAVGALLTHPDKWSGIGFVLSENDPFVFIDLDEPKNPDGSPLAEDEYKIRMNDQHLIYDTFDSYAELSPSGKGLHIIVKGKLPSGRKRSSVEVYSNARFMTMTGNVYRNVPIVDYNERVNQLWEQMGKGRKAELFYAGLEKAETLDQQVINYAATAINAEKFAELYYNGNWQKYYPSQSEADFAVIDILAFYSKNRDQVKKLFLQSKLAEREKSRANYRINYMLNRCFDNLLPPVDFEGLRNQVEEAIKKSQIPDSIQIEEGKAYLNLQEPKLLEDNPEFLFNPPNGLVGDIARFIYAQAPLPVPEIAIAGAIGLMSGICGKAYNVSNTGLNQYTLLLSSTGSGKEAIASGIAKIMKQIKKSVPAAGEFIGPAEIASPQALVKCLGDTPSIVSLVGEFGLALKQMASENAAPAQLGLRRMLLDLFNKSGENDELQRTIYSDRDKNTQMVTAPSFSLIGESTPERFYEILTENMISEGLLPRFNIIENLSPPADFNEGSALVMPSQKLVHDMAQLCAISLGLNSQRKVNHVQMSEDATDILRTFRQYAKNELDITKHEVRKQLWNRAHIKALKLSATVAVGENPIQPIISKDNANWAIAIVINGIKNLQRKFELGEVGENNDETKQLNYVVKNVKKFVTGTWSELEKTAGGEKMKTLYLEKVIPFGYLQRTTASAAAFRKDKMGANTALRRALKTLVDRGDLQQLAKSDLVKRFGTGAEAYAISAPGAFGI